MKVLIFAIALVLAPTVLLADPITVTGGSVTQWDDPAGGVLVGENLRLPLATNPLVTLWYPAGSTLDFSRVLSLLTGWTVGPATVNGETFSGVDTSGSLRMETGLVLVGLAMSAPFTMTGSLTGWTRDHPDPLFSVDVTGQGTLSAWATARGDGYRVEGVTFALADPAPLSQAPLSQTPEPLSLLLVGLGAAVLRWKWA